jgi:hypothetical protein
VPLVATGCAQLAVSSKVSSIPRPLLVTARPRLSNPAHPSCIFQIDGLRYAVFRLRLERDGCGSATASYCPLFGPGSSVSSTFCGLFMSWPLPLIDVAGAVRAERGYGVFVGPTSEVHSCGGKILLEFSFPSTSGAAWRAGLVSFAFRGKVRRKRAETFFPLVQIAPSPVSVGLLPFCPGRTSTATPACVSDRSQSSEPLPPFPGVFPTPPVSSVWDQAVMKEWASFFPCATLSRLAIAAASPGGTQSGFSGDRSKHVLHPNMTLVASKIPLIRAHLVDEVSVGRMLGPFPRAPFPNSWCEPAPKRCSRYRP